MIYAIILLLAAYSHAKFTLIPQITPGPEMELNWASISCQIPLPSVRAFVYQKYTYSSIIPIHEPSLAEGYLCSKETWSSVCNEGFFGQTTKKFTITRVSLGEGECTESIVKYESGTLDTPFKPEYTCSWLTENSNSKTFTLIKPHTVRFDHYDLGYKDGLFVGAACHQAVCETRYDNVLWVSKNHAAPHCPEKKMSTTSLYYNENVDLYGDFIVENEYIPYEQLHGSCKGLHYCGSEFVLTPFGQGFTLPNETIPLLTRYLDKLPPCVPGRMISLSQLSSTTNIQITIEEEFRIDRCLDAIEKIKSGLTLSRRDLYRLSPVLPGHGVGFIIRNKTIKSLPVTYLIGQIKSVECIPNYQHCLVAYYMQDNSSGLIKIDCFNALTSAVDLYCDWINGLILKDKALIVPDSGIRGNELINIITEEHELYLDPHVFLNDTYKAHISGVSDIPHFRNGDLWEYVSSHIAKWILDTFYGGIGLLCIVLLICFFPFSKVVSCFKNRLSSHSGQSPTGRQILSKAQFRAGNPDLVFLS